VLPLIERSLWTGAMAGGGVVHELAVLLRLGWHYASVLRRVLREQAYDCVFHPTALASDFMAWSLLPAAILRRANRVVLSTWFPLGDYRRNGPPRFARKLAYWKLMARRLKPAVASGRLALMTDSRRLADEYESLTGIAGEVLCSPRTVPVAVRDRPAPGESIVFGSIGAARLEKGIDLLQAAIERLAADGEDAGAQFVIQWNRPVRNADESELAVGPTLASHPGVDIVTRVLSSADYDALLAQIDCMVLPYRRARYHSRGSAVAVEAACAGIPLIYTADTWLADFVAEQGAGIAVADGDVAELARAIVRMKTDYPDFKRQAVQRSAVARERNSPERFVRTLWGLPG
jgi:glycosyltransferase involved in cell wall biosynthesis